MYKNSPYKKKIIRDKRSSNRKHLFFIKEKSNQAFKSILSKKKDRF